MTERSTYNTYASDIGYYLLWLLIILAGIALYSLFKSEPFAALFLPYLVFLIGVHDVFTPSEKLKFSSDIKKHFLKERFKSLRLLLAHSTLSFIFAWITYHYFGEDYLISIRLGLFGIGAVLILLSLFREIKVNREK